MTWILRNLALALSLVTASTCGTALADAVSVPTAAGTVETPLQPTRTVALDFAAADTLIALGVPLAGRPDFTPPPYLADALADIPTVGTLFEPDFEALARMAPDLIIAGSRSQSQVPALAQIAQTLDMTIDGSHLLQDAAARIGAYGAIFGQAETAAKLQAQLDAAIQGAAAAVAGKGDGLILMANGGKISAYGAASRFGWLHGALGLPEAVPGLQSANHGEAVSFEFVADADPDWLLVIDRGAAVGQGGEAAAATLDNPLIAATKAGANNQIIYLDGAAMYLADGGYHALMLVLDQITTAFGRAGS